MEELAGQSLRCRAPAVAGKLARASAVIGYSIFNMLLYENSSI
jgi:hypothetical protein